MSAKHTKNYFVQFCTTEQNIIAALSRSRGGGGECKVQTLLWEIEKKK